MRVTVEEIAKMAGVSKATVSRVLNHSKDGVSELTRQRVQKIIDDVNYCSDDQGTPGRSMRSRTIALVVPDIANPFFADIAKAVEARAAQENYIVIFTNTDFSEEAERRCITNLLVKKIDGIILVPTGSKPAPEHLLPEKYGIPMVLLDRRFMDDNRWVGVYADNEYASFRASEMLIRSPGSRVAFLSGPAGVSTSTERLRGYQAALTQHGIAFDPQLVKYGSYTVESGYDAVVELERAGVQYTSILAANDMMALGALRALKEFAYRIPEEIELIGFDNISFSQYLDPPLSTIQQPTIEMGTKSVELLLRILNGEKVSQGLRLHPRILMRKTTR